MGMDIFISKLMPLISAYLCTLGQEVYWRARHVHSSNLKGVCVGGIREGKSGWRRRRGEVSSQSLSNRACWRGLENVLWFTEEINIDFATRRRKSDFQVMEDSVTLKHRSDDAEKTKQCESSSDSYIYGKRHL